MPHFQSAWNSFLHVPEYNYASCKSGGSILQVQETPTSTDSGQLWFYYVLTLATMNLELWLELWLELRLEDVSGFTALLALDSSLLKVFLGHVEPQLAKIGCGGPGNRPACDHNMNVHLLSEVQVLLSLVHMHNRAQLSNVSGCW